MNPAKRPADYPDQPHDAREHDVNPEPRPTDHPGQPHNAREHDVRLAGLPPRPGRGRRVLIAAGVLVMAYAVGGALFDAGVNKVGVPVFLVALIVLHDGVFMPVVIGAGALAGRFVPARWQATVQAAGLVSLAVTVVALPLALGFGHDPANGSALPGPYKMGLILILVLIWGGAVGGRKGLERRRRENLG